ncbi:MAG: TlpA family protein disulfide reductase [Deltaproteobacteria bacterium]|nr:MAG: TlpA family protein disulfide reductase [Deltaproteobacteria bacterium]
MPRLLSSLSTLLVLGLGSPTTAPAAVGAGLLAAGLAMAPASARAAGDVAPGFTLKNLNPRATGYDVVDLGELRGKVVLLNFWATWCGPCKLEMPHLQDIYSDLGDQGLVVVSVSIDDARDKSQIKPVIMSKRLSFPVVHDQDTSVVNQYNPTKTLPFTVLIDRDGRIAQVHQGYNPGDESTLRAEVEALLSQPATPGD